MIHKLTKEQSTLIVSMWKKNDFEFLYDIGSQIYNRIFLLSPRTKQLFPYVVQAESRGENPSNTPGFRTQVLRFVQALSTVIVSMQSTDLSELTQVKRYLRDIGRRHRRLVHVGKKSGFKPSMWRVFQEALVQVMHEEFQKTNSLTSREKTMAEDGWSVIADFIISEMEVGFYGSSSKGFGSRNERRNCLMYILSKICWAQELNADANKNLVDSMETAERVDKCLAAAAHRPSILKGAKTPSPQSPEGGSHTATPISFNIVTINVSGRRYQTFAETLERYPDTLLGNPNRRMLFFNPSTNEYFFDRHRTCFEALLYFYQSPGRLRRPEAVPVDIFVNELRFFEMGDEIIEKFWILEGYRKPKFVALPKNRFQCKVWQLLEQPDSSMCARIVAFFSVFVIVLSTTSFCLETIPRFREIYDRAKDNSTLHNASLENAEDSEAEESKMNWSNPFCVIEFSCICWFTIELVCRFLSCPNKCTFCTSFLNVIDLVAIVPFFINLALVGQNSSAMSFAVLRIFRLVRVFRIFKLSRHSRGLQILGKTFKASVQELCLLVFFMMIALVLFSSAVYFAEQKTNPQFESIPATFWFTIATMTTVGYGDLTPKGASGKVVGGMCALVGVLVLALPVPVIVANFKHFYHQEKRLAHMHRVEQSEKEEESIDEESRSS